MLQGFTGQYPQKVDGKGRMSVPAAFRRVLESQDPEWTPGGAVKVHINYGKHLKDNLRVYSVVQMQQIITDITSLEAGSLLQRQLSRLYLGYTDEVTMDKDGRIVMPQPLRAKLGIESDAELTLMGVGGYFEIWRADRFEDVVDAEIDDLLETLEPGEDPIYLIAKARKAASA